MALEHVLTMSIEEYFMLIEDAYEDVIFEEEENTVQVNNE